MFQSTHPHGVRLAKAAVLSGAVRVSIHAPTRGATKYLDLLVQLLKVSIHAPTRGATVGKLGVSNFIKVSIHAPTRGATDFVVFSD